MTIDNIKKPNLISTGLAYNMYRTGKITYGDYQDIWAKNKGYKNCSDYQNKRNHITGRCGSMYDNKDCAQYLGVYIAEGILSKVFEKVQRMSFGNKGYDFICKNNFKIDVKSSCLLKDRTWLFNIKKNKIADYFLLLAFDNRDTLNPLHIWLIKSNEIITNERESITINEKEKIVISNSLYSLSKYTKYEQTDKLEKLINCCDTLRQNHDKNNS